MRYRAIRLVRADDGNNRGNSSFVFIDQPFWVETEYEILQPLVRGALGLEISTAEGQTVFCTSDENFEAPTRSFREPGVYQGRCAVPGNLLNQGRYAISLIGLGQCAFRAQVRGASKRGHRRHGESAWSHSPASRLDGGEGALRLPCSPRKKGE